MQQISVKTKLVAALSVILLVAFVVVSMVNYRVSREAVREEILTTGLPLTRDTIHSELRGELMRPLFVSSLMASDTFLRDWTLSGEEDTDQITKYLAEIKKRYKFFTAFFISDATSRYYYHGGQLKTLSRMNLHDVWYYEFVARGVPYDLDVDANEAAGGAPTLFVNYRVEDYKGYLLGVAGVGLSMEHFTELIQGYQKKYHRRIIMVDEFGRVQVGGKKLMDEGANIREMPGIATIAKKILALRGEPANFEYEGPQGTVLLTARHLDDIGWTLLVEQDEAAALASARDNFTRTIVVGIAAWVIIVILSIITVNHFQRRLVHMAVTDQLTGAANRWEFENRFAQAVSRLERGGTVFSTILLDLDNFKSVNDRLGHLEGDRVLTTVAELVRDIIRPNDLLARWGGDEFIILAEGTGEEARAMAERIRQSVAAKHLGASDGAPPVTVSCGVAEFGSGESLDALIRRADAGAYAAKESGRDRVVVCED